MLRCGTHHLAAHAGAAGEQQVIEWQLRERDSGIDVEAAHNAGLPAVIVLNGYMRSSEEAAKAAVTIASLEECPAAVGAIWMFGRERLPQLARPQRPTRD